MSRKEVIFVLKLKEFRQKRGLTQQELANLVHLHRVTIASFESGKNNPTLENMLKFCEVLNITPNDLLGFNKGILGLQDYLMSLKEEKK
jgi:DNA-binding XRE family transcriptional regulator